MNDYTSVADLYDSYVTETRDHAFWSRWAAQATGPILELTAGSGRATIALASSTSHCVVALDLAPGMLGRLVNRLRGTSQRVWALAGDMTRLPLAPDRFDLVAVPFNSFGELVEVADRELVLSEMRRVLVPAGRGIVTLHDPARRRETLDGKLRQLGPFSVDGHRLEVSVKGRLLTSDLAESEQAYRIFGAGDRLLDERRLTLRFALPDADSLLRAAAKAGLNSQALFGDYDESPYVVGKSAFIIAVLVRS